MRIILIFLLALGTLVARAQSSAQITISSPTQVDYIYTLTVERVKFHETLGVGLAETEFENIAVFDLSVEKDGTIDFPVSKPVLVRLTISPKKPTNTLTPTETRSESRTQLLYIVPGENLKIKVAAGNALTFESKNADYQVFLQDYFLENHYQYLSAFRFDPKQIKNDAILRQSDSLTTLRTQKYKAFKASHAVDNAFDSYVLATTQVEPQLLRTVVRDREMRNNRPVPLTPEQQDELDRITTDNFKIFPDEALLSLAYRNELRHWISIPVTQKYRPEKASQYALRPEAVSEIYQSSREKLADYPGQQEYLLTYWLNYAATALPSMKTARTLFDDFSQRFPKSKVKSYFSNLIQTKEKLEKGSPAPDFTLLNRDSASVSLSSLRGQKLAVAFAFNLGQYEPTLKLLEEVKSDSVLFVYISVAPSIPFRIWKERVEARPHALHLYASDEVVEKLKATYAIEPRFPFMVIDAEGRIVDRWIPQKYPRNEPLLEALK